MKKPVSETQKRKKLLMRQLRTPRTINQVIQRIKERDDKKGEPRDWRFYVHLNKLPLAMERQGLIKQVGQKVGPTKRPEKVWQNTRTVNG